MFSRRLGDSSVATGSALRHFCVPVLRVFHGGNVDKEHVKLHVLLCVILHAVLIYFYV